MSVLVEVCCGSADDVVAAERGGASRAELNSALALGGLTPTVAALRRAKREAGIPVCCMVRPRPAGFCYSNSEFALMLEEAEALLANGADGIVFGCLREDAAVDLARVRQMVSLAHARGAQAVFHRAIDVTPDLLAACAGLVSVGVDRVLTSGGAPTAPEGTATIGELVRRYGRSIEVIAGSGVRPGNVARLVRETGVSQVHSSCGGQATDPTTSGAGVSFAYLEGASANCYGVVDEDEVRQLVSAVQ